jgi:predicted Zn-dependent peptidase
MLLRGTEKKNSKELNEAFESSGIEKGVTTHMEDSLLWSRMIYTKLEKALPLFQEILLTPSFSEEEIEAAKQLTIQEIRRQQDEPMQRIFELARQYYYQNSAFARKKLGTKAEIEALQRGDILTFYRKYYQPGNSIFAIAGKFDWEVVIRQIEDLFGTWEGASTILEVPPPQPHASVAVELQEGNQEHLACICPAPTYTDDDYYAGKVISEAFGGSMASRLFVEVREKRGLVYGISSIIQSYKYSSFLLTYAGTTPQQAQECLQVVLEQLQLLEHTGLTNDEIMRAKVQLKSETILNSEGSFARMQSMLTSWHYVHEFRTVSYIKNALDMVTPEQIQTILANFAPSSTLTIVGIGPVEKTTLLKSRVSVQ